MPDEINHHRRRFFGAAAMAVAATQLGMIGPCRSTASLERRHAIKPERTRPSARSSRSMPAC